MRDLMILFQVVKVNKIRKEYMSAFQGMYLKDLNDKYKYKEPRLGLSLQSGIMNFMSASLHMLMGSPARDYA